MGRTTWGVVDCEPHSRIRISGAKMRMFIRQDDSDRAVQHAMPHMLPRTRPRHGHASYTDTPPAPDTPPTWTRLLHGHASYVDTPPMRTRLLHGHTAYVDTPQTPDTPLEPDAPPLSQVPLLFRGKVTLTRTCGVGVRGSTASTLPLTAGRSA